jgi:hypothetical protein
MSVEVLLGRGSGLEALKYPKDRDRSVTGVAVKVAET